MSLKNRKNTDMDTEHKPPPKVFVSYSHDTPEHKRWVLEFATTIRERGVDAILDQWHLRPGDDLPHFMDTQLVDADYVLIICTEKYVEKANKGTGGVGYEKMIMSASLLSRIDSNKVIPIIRQNGTQSLPTFMATKLFIDFSNDEDIEYNFDDLLRTLLDAPLFVAPPIGTNPFKPMTESRPDRTSDGVRQVMSDIALAYTGTSSEYVEYKSVVERTELSRLTLDMYVSKAIDEELLKRHPNYFTKIKTTPKGLKYLRDRKII
jgi:hypothetical protein